MERESNEKGIRPRTVIFYWIGLSVLWAIYSALSLTKTFSFLALTTDREIWKTALLLGFFVISVYEGMALLFVWLRYKRIL